MAKILSSFDTAHRAALHDARLDYYGKKLVTASSDHTLKVWDVSRDEPQYLSELVGHEGPVWQVAWAHPRFGSVLASCSYDGKVFIWKEQPHASGRWKIVHRSEAHCGSVNAVSFAPWEQGLTLAAGSSDGTISILSHYPDHSWHRKAFIAHPNGVNTLSWSPAPGATSGNTTAGAAGQMPTASRLASGGCDGTVRIWSYDPLSSSWTESHKLARPSKAGTNDWVRDVAWRPFVGQPASSIASCSEKYVVIWTQETNGGPWAAHQVLDLQEPVWRVCWSITGAVLAVASGEDDISLFTETLDGKWEKLPPPVQMPPSEVSTSAAHPSGGLGSLDMSRGMQAENHIHQQFSSQHSGGAGHLQPPQAGHMHQQHSRAATSAVDFQAPPPTGGYGAPPPASPAGYLGGGGQPYGAGLAGPHYQQGGPPQSSQGGRSMYSKPQTPDYTGGVSAGGMPPPSPYSRGGPPPPGGPYGGPPTAQGQQQSQVGGMQQRGSLPGRGYPPPSPIGYPGLHHPAMQR